ncbi:hypothetical protein CHS0354_020598 [Potamilus streckersoni]|uniref:Polycystin domain-containing protein n=1 Tax=Potamilus streckersoni TaxID=2493646 RepID=A0AAE0RRM6_9BIVA|nr:hypothetical protein CHS0354_020598 [Potamilus streckersoni]
MPVRTEESKSRNSLSQSGSMLMRLMYVWGIPVTGQYNMKLYGGGGYIVKLDVNRNLSEDIIKELSENNWKAVFLEFSLHNPNANLFSFVKYVAEYPETDFYYTTFMFLVIFCLMTMATTILNESIEHVTRKPHRSGANALGDILLRQILKFVRQFDQPKKKKRNKVRG